MRRFVSRMVFAAVAATVAPAVLSSLTACAILAPSPPCLIDANCPEDSFCAENGFCAPRLIDVIDDSGTLNPQVDAGIAVDLDAGDPLPDGGQIIDEDSGEPDPEDAGNPIDEDSGVVQPEDAGNPDPEDAGSIENDAGVNDAGVNDAGVNDAGVNDAGVNDAGVNDAGTPSCIRDADCSNTLFCDGIETCVAGICHAGTPSCDDVEYCDEGANTCLQCISDDDCFGATPYCGNDGACTECILDADCDDQAFCNGVETCSDGVCIAGITTCAFSNTNALLCDEDTDQCVNCFTDTDCPSSTDPFCKTNIVNDNSGIDAANASNQCVACLNDADCNDDLFCNGISLCVDDQCAPLIFQVDGRNSVVPCGGNTTCNEDTDQCESIPSCGNFVTDATEECDDGNDNDFDSCNNSCRTVRRFAVSSSENNIVIAERASIRDIEAFGDNLSIVIDIPAGVVVGSSDINLPALSTGTLNSTWRLKIINRGAILGKGGDGGAAGSFTGIFPFESIVAARAGQNGGVAFATEHPVVLDNFGLIGGGGGGGGGGAADFRGVRRDGGGGGGGGAGAEAGRGGSGSSSGRTASSTIGGEGGENGDNDEGIGGRGGDLGQDGQRGGNTDDAAGGAGGTAGAALRGTAFIQLAEDPNSAILGPRQ